MADQMDARRVCPERSCLRTDFGCCAPYLFDQSALRGVDPCQAAVSCMVAASSLIRESIYLQMMADSHGWREHARIWGAVIGDPSTRKGVGIA